jgi:D-glycero-alpha-D-manno-heptose 1-phosphate guanylyltransferase
MIREAVILAGGLGTRLREAVPDLPKCMAPVNGQPFLDHVIGYLKEEGIERFIFSLGYMHEIIQEHLHIKHNDLAYEVAIEKEPLGTGGAIRLASSHCREKDIVVTNGDTLFKIDLTQMSEFHSRHAAACTLALKPMINFDRYGVVELNKDDQIISFLEKRHYASGLINGGVYALNKAVFESISFPEKFSFEKDFLEVYHSSLKMMGIVQDSYFIDIGIPEDFARAGKELKNNS